MKQNQKLVIILCIVIFIFSFFLYDILKNSADDATDNISRASNSIEKSLNTDSIAKVEESKLKLNDSIKGARIDEILKPFKRSYDEVEDIEFYHTYNRPILANNIYMYLGRKKNEVWSRLVIQYYAEDWLFVRNWTLKTDSDKITIEPSADIVRDNSGSHVWETCDMPVEGRLSSIPGAIITSEKTTLRFNGDDYYHDMKISLAQKKAIMAMSDAIFKISKLE